MRRPLNRIALLPVLVASLAQAAADWGGGGAVFKGHDGQALNGADGLAVLVSVHSGSLIDYTRFLPTAPADLITAGRTLTDRNGNKNIVLATSTAFTSGYLMNSLVPNISKEMQQAYGASAGEPFHLLVWDARTFVSNAPAVGSAFSVATLYVDGQNTSPAQTYGYVPPALPMVAKPDGQLSEVQCNSVVLAVTETVLVFQTGWNLMSTPLVPLTPAVGAFFEGKNSGPVWEWSTGRSAGRFSKAVTVETKRGYWVYLPSPDSVQVSGVADTDKHLALKGPGWNLIGVLTAMPQPQDSRIRGCFWWWDASARAYVPAPPDENLVAGRGYWIYVTADVTVDLD
jgi:hypothetical protein